MASGRREWLVVQKLRLASNAYATALDDTIVEAAAFSGELCAAAVGHWHRSFASDGHRLFGGHDRATAVSHPTAPQLVPQFRLRVRECLKLGDAHRLLRSGKRAHTPSIGITVDVEDLKDTDLPILGGQSDRPDERLGDGG